MVIVDLNLTGYLASSLKVSPSRSGVNAEVVQRSE